MEIGFGPGLAILQLSREARAGYVCGVDHSELMIAVAHQPRGPGATDETSAAKGRELASVLARAGFSPVQLRTLPLKPAVVCALGVNDARS